MNYADFKDYLTTFLWKVGDQQLIGALDSLIRMADAELGRKLPISMRETTEVLTVDAETFPLPGDYAQMITVSNDTLGPFRNTTRALLDQARAADPTCVIPKYYVQSTDLLLVGPYSVENPEDLAVTYRRTIPSFATTDSSWLEEDYLDLYTYAVLKHTATFLREDDRVQVWVMLFNDALTSTIEEDLWTKQYGGSPLDYNPPRNSY